MKKIIYLLILLTNSYFINAQWVQTNGPEGGSIQCFVKDSLNRWFIGTLGNGVYYSTNEGASWIISNNGITYGKVNGMAIDSTNFLYAATERGLFRSSNSGATWIATSFSTNVMYSITVDASNRLFVSTGSTVWMSTDNGSSFTPSGIGLIGSPFYNLTIAPNNYMFTNSSTGGIFRSTDFGANWSGVNSGLPSTYVGSINAAPNNYLYAGISGNGIYLSTNNGDNWVAVNSGLGNMFVNGIGSFGNMVFAGTNNGIYKTTNFGTNWIAVNNGFTATYTGCAGFGFVSGTTVFAGTYAFGVLKSTDSGNSWFKSSSGINATQMKSLAVASNGNIFAAFTGAIYVSTNNGASFQESDAGVTNLMNNIVRIHPNGYIFAGTFPMSGTPLSGIFRSTNNGVNWSAAMSGFQYQFNNVLDFAFDSSGYIYCASNDNVYKSTNLGTNWFRANTGITNSQVYSIAVDKQNNFIYAGTYGSGIFRSKDNGSSFTAINNGLTATQIMSLEINSGGQIFAGSNGYGVFRSTNNGDLWEQVLSLPSMQAWKVAINSLGHIYAGIVGGLIVNLGVWRSIDNGANWVQVSDGILYPFIDALCFDSSGYTYAGSLGGGLYKSTFVISVKKEQTSYPKSFSLSQNYPNPFNPTTKIKYEVPLSRGLPAETSVQAGVPEGRGEVVRLIIYDILGREVAVLVNEKLQPGTYEVEWDAANFPSGVYFYTLKTENYFETKKMILLK